MSSRASRFRAEPAYAGEVPRRGLVALERDFLMQHDVAQRQTAWGKAELLDGMAPVVQPDDALCRMAQDAIGVAGITADDLECAGSFELFQLRGREPWSDELGRQPW